MLCRRLNKIIYTPSPIHNSSQRQPLIIARSKCSWINSVFSALNTDPMSSYRLRLILRDLSVTRLWNAWFRTQLVSSMVKRCRRDRSMRDMLACFKQTILRPSRTFLLSATAACKSSQDDKPGPCQQNISETELEELTRAFDSVDELSRATLFCAGCNRRLIIDKQHPGVLYCACPDTHPPGTSEGGWAPYMEADDVIIWRKEYKPGGLYAYKVYGRYKDLHASTFATIQLDGAYRRSWDDAVAALSLVEREANGVKAQSVLHWEVAWPRLFSNRDYVYIRRHKEFDVMTKCQTHKEAIFSTSPDPCAAERPSVHTHAKRKGMEDERRGAEEARGAETMNKVYVIISRSCTHPSVPEASSTIRVQEYWSDMVVRSLDGAQKPGMEFVLTYYDEPAVGGMPRGVSAWATGRAAPSYLARMRRAALAYSAWTAAHTEELDFEPFGAVSAASPAAAASEPKNANTTVEVQVSGPNIQAAPQRRTEVYDKSTQTEEPKQPNKGIPVCNEEPKREPNASIPVCGDKGLVPEVKAEEKSEEKPKTEADSESETKTSEKPKTKEDECGTPLDVQTNESEGERKNSWWRYLYPFYYFA